MSSIFFVIKVGIITFLIVMLMQVQVGENSLETQSHQFIVEASKKLKLNEVAVGIVQFMREAQDSTDGIMENLIKNWSKSKKQSSDK